nr:succinate dehydrogenase assembly factor 2 [Oceanomicrobium pacificus]
MDGVFANGEAPENRLKRMRMRCWRRGTKEMDMVLGPFADAELAGLSPDALDQLDALLEENDQDLYAWLTRQSEAPADHAGMLDRLRAFHGFV